MPLALAPRTTAFLFMDFQLGIIFRVAEQAEALLPRVGAVLEAARGAGAWVGFVKVAFRPRYPEVSDRNQAFSTVKVDRRMLLDSPEAAITDTLAPRDGEPVIVKHRVGAFPGTDLETLLRAKRIDTLVLLGISTSGCVLSTLRHAADHDYRLVVASDGCADPDPEVHRVLMEKVFPRQATVATTAQIVEALKGGT